MKSILLRKKWMIFMCCVSLTLGTAAWSQNGMRSETVVYDLEAGQNGLQPSSEIRYLPGTGIQLAYDPSEGFRPTGTLVSPWLDAPIPMSDLVLCWNFNFPMGTGAVIDLRVGRENAKTTSAWYEMGRIGMLPDLSKFVKTDGIRKDAGGSVEADNLILKEKWTQFQYRVTFFSGVPHHSPTLRLISVSCMDPSILIPYTPYKPNGKHQPWMRSLPVRWRSQVTEEGPIAGRVCGPTSLAGALDYLGCNISTADLASEAFDYNNQLFGNWPFLSQAAAQHGFKAWTSRCQDFTPLEKSIAAGRPIVLSIAFNKGELDGAPIGDTDGHLILCVGMTPEGDLICNDSASADKKWDHVVYKRDDMATAWLKRGGGAIFIEPRSKTSNPSH